jgi:hypothetical protein
VQNAKICGRGQDFVQQFISFKWLRVGLDRCQR